ncbi:MAG: hypothetical protein WCB95_00390, partial [Aeromicrobium sp.]
LKIGAQDVHMFVGIEGPYWVDTNGNGVIDRDSEGQIVDSEVNEDAIGLVIDDVDFALAIGTPVLRLDPTRYIALTASAAFAGLVGLEDEGLTAHAKGIDVALNISTPLVQGFPLLPVIDFDAYAKRDCPTTGTCPEDKLDPFQVKVAAPSELGGEAPAEDFMFPGLLVRASVADINIDVFGVLAVRGSIALELGPQVDVTLTNGNVVEGVTTLTLGGANLLGFVGVNGPHWTEDEDGNVIWKGGCVPGPNVDCEVVLNPDAVGIGISDLDFGIFIGLKGDVTNPNVFIAADVRVDGFGLVGLPDGFTAAGTLAVALNLGFGLAGLAGIDFKRSFTYDPDGEQEEPGDPGSQCASGEVIEGDPHCDDLPGLALNSGNDDNPILIDFEDTFISVQLAGVIAVGEFAFLNGVFFLEISEEGLNVLVLADLRIGPDLASCDSETGVCGSDPLFKAGALGILIINGEGIAADLAVQLSIGNDDIGLSLDVSARLLMNLSGGADQVLEIPDTLWAYFENLQNGVSPTGGTIDPAIISDPGSMTGQFLARLVDCDTTDTDTDRRCYVIHGEAPRLISNGDVDSNTIAGLLGEPGKTITRDATGSNYIAVALSVDINILGFAEAHGLAAISLRDSAFEMVLEVTFVLGPSPSFALNVKAEGALGLYADGVFLNASVAIKANLLSVFDLDVSGTLTIDTTTMDGTARTGYFHVVLDGSVKVLHIITLNGSLDIAVADSGWAVSATLGARFGPLSMSANGFILSTGSFSFTFRGEVDLTIAGTGIEGFLSAHLSYCERPLSGGSPNRFSTSC